MLCAVKPRSTASILSLHTSTGRHRDTHRSRCSHERYGCDTLWTAGLQACFDIQQAVHVSVSSLDVYVFLIKLCCRSTDSAQPMWRSGSNISEIAIPQQPGHSRAKSEK